MATQTRPAPNECTTRHLAKIPCGTCGGVPPSPDLLHPWRDGPLDATSWAYWYERAIRWGGDEAPTPSAQIERIGAASAELNAAVKRLEDARGRKRQLDLADDEARRRNRPTAVLARNADEIEAAIHAVTLAEADVAAKQRALNQASLTPADTARRGIMGGLTRHVER